MNKTFFYFLLIGAFVFPLRADSEQPEVDESALVANSTAVPEDVPKLELFNATTKTLPTSTESTGPKPQKIKKKILISNPKNSTEKIVLGNDKYLDRTQGNATEEDLRKTKTEFFNVTEVPVNVTDGRRAKLEESTVNATQNDTFEPEGRSFPDGDAKRNFKYFNRKNKVTTSTTENYGSKQTPSSYMHFTLGEVQKAMNNNYLKVNEDLGNSKTNVETSNTPSLGTTAALPRGKPSSISGGNSAKNLVRLENGRYASADQTDWIPLVPIRNSGSERYPGTQPVNTRSTVPVTTVKPMTYPFVKPITPFTLFKRQTTEPSLPETDFPSSTVASNSLPVHDLDEESSSSNVDIRKVNGTNKNRYRGSIRFRLANLTNFIEVGLKHNSTKVSNVTGDGLQKLEIPPTGTWDVATVQDFSPVRITTTESVKNATATTEATANVTEPTKPKNIAKVQVLKNTVSDKVASDNPMSIFKFTETEPPSNMSKPPETTSAPARTTTETAPSSKGTEVPVTTPVPTAEANKTTTSEEEIEVTLSREILKISTVPPKTTQTYPTTTVRDEPTTTTMAEEPPTIVPVAAETEAIFTTEEPLPETTFRGVTEPDVEVNTEMPPEEAPVPQRESDNGTTAATTTPPEVTPATEKENDIPVLITTEPPPREEVTQREHHPHIHHEITEENVPAYLKLTVEAASWEELCRLKDDLKNAIIHMLDGTNVTAESIVFLNLNEKNCRRKIEESKDEPPSNLPVYLPVNMFIMNENGDFDKNLSEAFLNVWGQYGLDFELPIRKVDFLSPLGGLYDLPNDSVGVSVIAAIVISCVAGLCVILLGILFVVMKRRQKRFNYGQRCTPVSLDAYSLDSVSIHNSVRRKGIRTSKRSYGNAAFDDPEVPSHPMNFAGLANFSSDKEQLYEEFNIIPQVYPKTDELPAGAETKNRYANVIPLPETRVHLSVKDGDSLSDYINANYVRGLKGAEKLYIACQAPMESTVEDFWRMIWEQQCKVVIMLTDLQENGVEKCTDYLPPNEVTDNLRLFGDFQVTMKKRDVKEKYIVSHLKLKNMEANLWREVTHLWYLGWPEQGVPSEANSLIAFLIEARSQMKSQTGSTAGPAVVHCSPGTGRTGTVIACDLCIREFEQTRMVDIPKCVFNLRKNRAGSVQTKDQYAFIYQVLNVYATKLTGGGLESI
ncbi:UNVERIFIED_CONTAM: hypothetical protein PYX00_008561 [Menopon gallinae]|uniref:protein-tyrosine-phosphatase n=1 Tax=Menopon gallinae TaxID=328185 RepID=A0AAW2HPW3_9NEOP